MKIMKQGRFRWDWQFFGVFVIIVFVVYILFYFVQFAGRECYRDSDCPAGNYCGSDYSCHIVPAASERVIQSQPQLASALIIALAIIVAAFIIRKKS